MHLREALLDIAEIRSQIARTEQCRALRSASVGFSGVPDWLRRLSRLSGFQILNNKSRNISALSTANCAVGIRHSSGPVGAALYP